MFGLWGFGCHARTQFHPKVPMIRLGPVDTDSNPTSRHLLVTTLSTGKSTFVTRLKILLYMPCLTIAVAGRQGWAGLGIQVQDVDV
jgi:hypothetical protein